MGAVVDLAVATQRCVYCRQLILTGSELDAGGQTACEVCEPEHRCSTCDGTGEVHVLRNRRGEIDDLDGEPTGEMAPCEACDGCGYTW